MAIHIPFCSKALFKLKLYSSNPLYFKYLTAYTFSLLHSLKEKLMIYLLLLALKHCMHLKAIQLNT